MPSNICPIRIEPLTTSSSDLRFFVTNCWSSFNPFYDIIEPVSRRPKNEELRIQRWCNRIRHFVASKETLCLKAIDERTGKDVACSVWFVPNEEGKCFNLKRRIAGMVYDEDDWEGVDEKAWEELWGRWDDIRARLTRGLPHYYLAPLWVLPDYQGQGIGSALIQHVVDICDSHSPPIPIYLEASKEGKGLYEIKFNFQVVGGSDYVEMIRWGKTEKEWTGPPRQLSGSEAQNQNGDSKK